MALQIAPNGDTDYEARDICAARTGGKGIYRKVEKVKEVRE
jgi:hypothetical protein